MKHTFEDSTRKPAGFLDAYLHRGSMTFVPLSDLPGHGYLVPKGVEMVDERHVKNLIVTNASKFMAKRMRPGTSWGSGITHLEVGTGVGTGTTQVPQGENAAQIALRTPLTREPITTWTCLDTGGNPTGADTNVIQYTTTFIESKANGALVEMGMFGGDATTALGSGQMFNYKSFPVINKDNTMQLTLVWKLTF